MSCRLLSNRIGLWSAECGYVNQHQHVFAAQNPCANTFNSSVGSNDSGTRDQPRSSTTLYIVERELAWLAYLCHYPLHWLRLLTRALSIGSCQCSYIFVSCWTSVFILQETQIKNIFRSNCSHEYLRSRFTRAHPLESELPSAIKYFLKVNSHQIECFFEAMDLHTTFGFQSSWRCPFENIFKRTMNSPVTWTNMNEPSTHRTNWRYHCSVTYVT